MTITTSRGQTFDVLWCWGPLSDGTLMLAMQDLRPIWQIAQELDGLTRIWRKSENEGDATYEGYSEMTAIAREERTGEVTVRLRQPKTA